MCKYLDFSQPKSAKMHGWQDTTSVQRMSNIRGMLHGDILNILDDTGNVPLIIGSTSFDSLLETH